MSVSEIDATRTTRATPSSMRAEALGLTMRERASVRADHPAEYRHNEADKTWYVACLCGWGTSSPDAAAVSDWHGEHVAGWLLDAANSKRADLRVQRALEEGDALTRERYAEADAAVTSIAPVPMWVQHRPGATAHRMSEHNVRETLCGRTMPYGTALVTARAYTRKCAECVR